MGFERRFLNFMADAVFPDMVLSWGRFCLGAFRSRNFIETWFINLGNLSQGTIFLFSLEKSLYINYVWDIT